MNILLNEITKPARENSTAGRVNINCSSFTTPLQGIKNEGDISNMIPSIYTTNIITALFYEHTQYWASMIHEHINYYLTNFIQQIMFNTSFSLLVIG